MMLKLCQVHGPFRGEKCPQCGKDGKIILNDWEFEDENGWANISDIALNIRNREKKFRWVKDYHIEYFVLTDPKGRFQMDPEKKRIRAVYGHSIDVDLSDLPKDDIPSKLYYAIDPQEEEFIKEIGIKPGERRWIHLS
ncbi:MAG: RNA 2'-phosphotransferase, partial [Thermoplasmata archaeon]